MKFTKQLTALTASLMLAAPLISTTSSSLVQAAPTASTTDINTMAKQYSYSGVTYLYEWLAQQGITYNKFYTENKIEYQNGKPDGIVIHETATPGATAYNEAIYFNREWMNMYAYVHAFVDQNTVMQMMTPDYGAWGAGPMANDRFIQVELCEVDTIEDFAKSVNNDAIYCADLLHRYGLKPDNASSDGEGTIWSHAAVSKFLGKTDHGDPDGYFAKWGYSMDQFYDLIVYYYNKKSGSTNTSSSSKTETKTETQAQTITQPPVVKTGKQTLMHDAYLYDANGKKIKTKPLQKAGTVVTIKKSILINKKKYYQVSGGYIVASNLDGTMREIVANSYIYNSSGTSSGMSKLLKGNSVRTYGSKVTIAGIKYYAIGANQFVKANNLK
ncbi:SLAP domain-containing protein [Lactobacillus pasteurii]|uniref:LytB n=1 Tax=Lactobacillus pasteurii DSM 23907 = CRBIP 24.76 TaxID=1423790 RepID=I7IZD4_9LACO|nr:SLAP domain-containing protein [Lactobacillus pasteurii]TDG75903.1 hypothetical protein C5L33_001461 [Lactobacillus pasteurii]CCI85032.1 LytB [Lactobacillus pasteurii DSM 23907 = CRBIP 24.76]